MQPNEKELSTLYGLMREAENATEGSRKPTAIEFFKVMGLFFVILFLMMFLFMKYELKKT